MSNCSSCGNWITRRVTAYDDGSEVENFRAPDGKGHCEVLNIDTAPEFGCNSHVAGDGHVIIAKKTGAPWQSWHMGPCPDCSAKGNAGEGACDRCTGTGNVRYYDDGFVGEEKTRMHPKEKDAKAYTGPKCLGCGRDVEPEWVSCPRCGHKLDAVAAVEKVSDPLFDPPPA